MKVRSGYVSNSSSSSFLVAYNERSEFDSFKEDRGYYELLKALPPALRDADDQQVAKFLRELLEGMLIEYADEYFKKAMLSLAPGDRPYVPCEFVSFLQRLGCDEETLEFADDLRRSVEKEVDTAVRKHPSQYCRYYVDISMMREDDFLYRYGDMVEMLVIQAQGELMRRFRTMAIMEVEDSTEAGAHLERSLLPRISESNGDGHYVTWVSHH